MAEQERVIIVDGEGKRHVFPSGFDPRRAASIVKQQTQSAAPREPGLATIGEQVQAKWSDKLGLNEPTASPLKGFAQGAGGAVVDMWEGAASEIVNRLRQKNVTDDARLAAIKTGDPNAYQHTPQLPPEQKMSAPDTVAGTLGTFAPGVAEMAIPVGGATKAAVNAIPTTAKAAAKFQSVMAAAKNVPIEVKEVGDVALRITELAERGGSMPMAVRKLLNRITDPEKAAMVYEEARDFASNISRLSADEFGRLTPVVAKEVANLRVALNKANAIAAKQVGKADEYAAAMKEYSNAMRVRGVINAAIEGAKKAAPVAGAAAAGYWVTKRVRDALWQ